MRRGRVIASLKAEQQARAIGLLRRRGILGPPQAPPVIRTGCGHAPEDGWKDPEGVVVCPICTPFEGLGAWTG
jgi:hypothetical protein